VLQRTPQLIPSQVEEPFEGVPQALHELPQLAVLLLLRHCPPQA
jgi:hypothetical protein